MTLSPQTLEKVNQLAHLHTFHPNSLPWGDACGPGELEYLSRVGFGSEGHEKESLAYVVKELAQLAEIERHVSAVMAIALSEAQNEGGPLVVGSALHDAISCFAAEEINHSNVFYRYVRALSGQDFIIPDNLFSQRLQVFLGEESAYVKLAALCCTAYIGESIITVFERRTRAHDPHLQYFLPKLLHLHNLDEARHVETDHWVINELIPTFNAEELEQMRSLIQRTAELNFTLAMAYEAFAKEVFGIDYTVDNEAHSLQMRLTIGFAQQVLMGTIRPLDEAMDDETRALVTDFSGRASVHV